MKRHSEGKVHKQEYSSLRCQRSLNFKSASHPVHQKETAAEIRNTVMIALHNASLCLSDHIGQMQRKHFPDSEIVKSYHFARTKTACILNHALEHYLKNELIDAMRKEPYSLYVDASNNSRLSKMNPLTVIIFNVNKSIVSPKFLEICLILVLMLQNQVKFFRKLMEF